MPVPDHLYLKMYPGYRPAPGSEWLRCGKGSLQKEWSFPHLHEPEFLYKYVLSVSFPPISPVGPDRYFFDATISYYSEIPCGLQREKASCPRSILVSQDVISYGTQKYLWCPRGAPKAHILFQPQWIRPGSPAFFVHTFNTDISFIAF